MVQLSIVRAHNILIGQAYNNLQYLFQNPVLHVHINQSLVAYTAHRLVAPTWVSLSGQGRPIQFSNSL